MILPIYTLGQPVLRKVAEDIDPDDPELQKFVQDMFDTLDHSSGIGLAAPQVGRSQRVVVIDLNPIKDDYPQYEGYRHVFYNPYIEEYDKSNQESMDEGCLSLPGMSETITSRSTTNGLTVTSPALCSMSLIISTAKSTPTTSSDCASR